MKTALALLLCVVLFYKADGYYGYGFMKCHFESEDGHDTVYTAKLYFNKQLLASYNSTEGKYSGYTEKTKEITDGLNKNPHFMEEEKKNLAKCKQAASVMIEGLETAAQKPKVRVFASKTASPHTPGIIVCSAYNFYPKDITLTWLRNGEEVTSDVVSTDEMSNGNWLYQKHSYLEYMPTAKDTIHCMVEHASLPTPELHKWEYFTESRRNKITVGTAGLILGIAFVTVGGIYYKKHTKVHVLGPNN